MMTVVPAENSTLEDPPICTNLTYPAGILDVEARDHTGILCVEFVLLSPHMLDYFYRSQYGWVDQVPSFIHTIDLQLF